MISTTIGVIDGVDSNIPWLSFFKRSLAKPQIYMGRFKHLINLVLHHVKIMFNVGFMVPRTLTTF